MSLPTSEVQSLTPGTLVVLYELDATDLGDTIHRFHAGVNALGSDVVWQGNTYYRMPIQAEGFEISSKGVLPRPKIRVAAIDGAMGILVRGYDDLVGAKVTRKRTLAKFLDADNFAAVTATNEAFTPTQLSIGGVNVTAGVTVTAMTRTDWQGTQALYATARMNKHLCSESLATWTKNNQGTASAPILTADYAASPRGDTTADRLQFNRGAGTSAGDVCTIQYPVTGQTVGQPFAGGIWLKSNTGSNQRVMIYWTGFATGSGGGTITNVVTVTPEWQRFTCQANCANATIGVQLGCRASYGDAVLDILGWGAQIEQASVLGAYIGPTTSSPVTVTDYSATPAGVVTLGEAESGTYAWSGSGKLNALADPTAAFADDVFYVERKVYEGPDFLEFELVSALDLEGLLLPRRKFIRNVCTWDDATICAYSVNGLCPKDRVACEARWGTGQPLPFSGFLGISTQ